ncbi:FMN-binding protein [Petrocella atlantisensis]|uniref:FMN-binding protein n=1 Tax=Petrocella atlantisensis TaxID=2173034 RepID=A0A3P7S2F4_9FIRM|nr:FMN-binding protein [Petrocella atlantisensis]VDN49016.1 FMN-binding protein [Petrocella atlantisensis]
MMCEGKVKGLRGYFSLTFFLIIMIVLMVGCSERAPIYIPGTYINETEGYYSTLRVSVTVDQSHITQIEILSHEEPELLANVVFEELPKAIMKKNNIDVDVISGATYTSEALIDAVKKALEQAKVDEE